MDHFSQKKKNKKYLTLCSEGVGVGDSGPWPANCTASGPKEGKSMLVARLRWSKVSQLGALRTQTDFTAYTFMPMDLVIMLLSNVLV